MNLQHRINLLGRLGNYILENDADWQRTVEKAEHENGWFIPEFSQQAARAIAVNFLQPAILQQWTGHYDLPPEQKPPGSVGLVLAGNIPLAGFHDIMTVFIAGHKALIKPSSKDRILVQKLVEWIAVEASNDPAVPELAERLNGCNAYIATGSNNSSRYFEFYFGKYPHIFRKNRTSIAILDGNESYEELDRLADDVFMYFGLGCRNVTKLFVPRGYDFLPLLAAFKKYAHLADHHKYKNNYDYNLALHLLNKVEYMTNGSVLLVEKAELFSPVSQLNYSFYDDPVQLRRSLEGDPELQCIVSRTDTRFGTAQFPAIDEYADGIDTLEFLSGLPNRL